MRVKRKTAQRRADRVEAKKDADAFKPGRGRQLACLVEPLYRTDGLMRNPVKPGDLDTEHDTVDNGWNHSGVVSVREFVDAEEPGWPLDEYKWPRSMLLYIPFVSVVLGLPMRQAYDRVRTDPELRRIGGFAPRPSRHERRKKRGASQLEIDPGFPLRQSVVDWIDRWLGGKKPKKASPIHRESFVEDEVISERGQRFLEVVEKAMQEIAFENILTYNLDTTRLVMDNSIVLSGHRQENPVRTDFGAKWFKKDDEWFFARMLGSVQMVGTPFVITSEVARPDEGEPGIVKDILLPQAAEASRRLTEYAKARDRTHPGFKGAAMCADAAFQNHPCIEATFAAGFLPAYNVGGDKGDIDGHRDVETTTGKIETIDVRDDGGLLCRCAASVNQPKQQPMRRQVVRPGQSAKVTCPFCNTTYLVTPRKPDDDTAVGDKGDFDLRYDITLPRWEPRVVALCFKARNEIESMHRDLDGYALLPDSRGGKEWRGLTGTFRHRFWYRLGHLVWNIRIEKNLKERKERREYTWAEGWVGFQRNRHKLIQQDELTARRAARAARKQAQMLEPGSERKPKRVPVVAHELPHADDFDVLVAAMPGMRRPTARAPG